MQDKKIVAIELTSYCNLQCPHCPQGKVNIPHGYMKLDVFRKCLEHVGGHTELSWRGEPLLHPDLAAFVEVARQAKPDLNLGIRTSINTLTRAMFDRLAQAGLNWIHVSLHNDQSCQNYKSLLRWNRERPSPLALTADVETTKEELNALANGLTRDQFRSDFIANWAGFLTRYKPIYRDPELRASRCFFLRTNQFVVSWDGQVNACCWDFELRHRLGPVDTFDAIEHKTSYDLCKYCIWTVRSAGGDHEFC